MRPNGKWIEGIEADGSVDDAARLSLESRLSAVECWLPLAAHLADRDVEHVHRLRVSTRRAVAALKLYREHLPEKPRRWIKRRLRKIRRAAGEARDLDVLGDRLAKEYGEAAAPLVTLIGQERRLVQPAIVTVADRARRGDRFVRKAAKLLAGVGTPNGEGQPTLFCDWARVQLADAAERFFAAIPSELGNAAQLHQFRIQAKQLRYTLELVAPAFGRELREKHYPVVESLQERLGRIQDHAAAIKRLEKWSEEPRFAAAKDVLHEVMEKENTAIARAIEEFRLWWANELIDKLRAGLSQATAESAEQSAEN